MELTPEEKIIVHQMRKRIRENVEQWHENTPSAFRGYNLDAMLDSSWEGKIPSSASLDIKRWMKNPSPFLILHGPSGLGKTLMGMLVCERMLSMGVVNSAEYITATALLDGLSDYSDREHGGALGRAKNPRLLLLDDLGSGGMDLSPARRTGIWELIDHRWSSGKHTIITTNLSLNDSGDFNSPDTIEDYLGASAWDRLRDKQRVIPFHGSSSRKTMDAAMLADREERNRMRRKRKEREKKELSE